MAVDALLLQLIVFASMIWDVYCCRSRCCTNRLLSDELLNLLGSGTVRVFPPDLGIFELRGFVVYFVSVNVVFVQGVIQLVALTLISDFLWRILLEPSLVDRQLFLCNLLFNGLSQLFDLLLREDTFFFIQAQLVRDHHSWAILIWCLYHIDLAVLLVEALICFRKLFSGLVCWLDARQKFWQDLLFWSYALDAHEVLVEVGTVVSFLSINHFHSLLYHFLSVFVIILQVTRIQLASSFDVFWWLALNRWSMIIIFKWLNGIWGLRESFKILLIGLDNRKLYRTVPNPSSSKIWSRIQERIEMNQDFFVGLIYLWSQVNGAQNIYMKI